MWLKHKKIQGFYDVLQVSDCCQYNDDTDDVEDIFCFAEQELCRRSRCMYIAQVFNIFNILNFKYLKKKNIFSGLGKLLTC